MDERNSADTDLVITRVFDAPRKNVWKAWTDPEQLKKWWGPKAFTAPVIRIDFRVGGTYLYCMRAQDGKDYWSTGTYREIIPMERIVATDSFADESGDVVPASYYGMKGAWPLELLVTIIFEDHEGKTKMTLKHARMPAGENQDLARQGWNESFDKLAENLKRGIARTKTDIVAEHGKQDIIITREFNAPRELVFRAHTNPKIYAQWIGPQGLTTTLEKFEPRNGGQWRYIQKDKAGNEFAFHGVNHEVLAPERIIGTFEFEGLPETGHVILQTVSFVALPGGRTKVISQSVFQSVTDRDGMIRSGMELGVDDSYERLDELLAQLKK